MRWVVGDRAIDFDHLRDPWWSSASLVSVANSNLGISTRSPSSTSVGLITLGAAPPPQNTQDGRLFAKAVAMECAAGVGYGSTPSIPGSSTRRFGRSYRYRPGAMRRSTRTKWPKPGYRSAGPGRRRISRTGFSSSPLSARTTANPNPSSGPGDPDRIIEKVNQSLQPVEPCICGPRRAGIDINDVGGFEHDSHH